MAKWFYIIVLVLMHNLCIYLHNMYTYLYGFVFYKEKTFSKESGDIKERPLLVVFFKA